MSTSGMPRPSIRFENSDQKLSTLANMSSSAKKSITPVPVWFRPEACAYIVLVINLPLSASPFTILWQSPSLAKRCRFSIQILNRSSVGSSAMNQNVMVVPKRTRPVECHLNALARSIWMPLLNIGSPGICDSWATAIAAHDLLAVDTPSAAQYRSVVPPNDTGRE